MTAVRNQTYGTAGALLLPALFDEAFVAAVFSALDELDSLVPSFFIALPELRVTRVAVVGVLSTCPSTRLRCEIL